MISSWFNGVLPSRAEAVAQSLLSDTLRVVTLSPDEATEAQRHAVTCSGS